MNSVSLVGRLTRDPDVRYTGEQLAVARFTVAVERAPSKNAEKQADFISCVAFGKSAEFVEKYFSKGKPIGIQGRIQTGSYTNKEGQKVYTTDVVAERVEFVGSSNRQDESGSSNYGGYSRNDNSSDADAPGGFTKLMTDDDIPF